MAEGIEMNAFQLFFFFFRISAVTFGGGIVILGMVKLGLADRDDITEAEFSDMLSLAASVPGPLAVSIAWLLGRHYRGLKGSLAAVAGAVLPPFLIVLALSPVILAYSDEPRIQGFFKGVLAGTGAIITTVVFDNVRSTLMSGWWNVVPFAVVVVLIGLFGVHPLISMLAAFSLQMIRERLTER
ncbi:MAG TPA: chromate transporter [Synergistaceae bacterium]|jgi:chromate transporter|nr:chromate transporter [Synergistaceae bacterium]HPX03847.1 chromate transporter [Synergistaceae bacterium]HQA54732.1 chromate transporter [Synergistaceae bacterium]